MLTKWGFDVADNNVVQAFTQSSPEGYRTYKKCGFDEVYVTDLDLSKVGLEGGYRTSLMERYPRVKSERENGVSSLP